MADLGALLGLGMPPWGRGIWVREDVGEAARVNARFAAVNARRADAVSQALELGGAYVYSLIQDWTPDRWRESLEHLLRARAAIEAAGGRCHGIIANPEHGWSALERSARDAEVTALAEALGAVAEDTRVGVSSFPFWPGRERLIEAADGRLWFCVQLYGATGPSAQDLRGTLHGWYARWTDVAGEAHCIPAITGWVADPALHGTPQAFAHYLDSLPPAAGAMVFDGRGAMPLWMAEQLAAYEPGGSAAGTLALAARGALVRPAGVAVGVAVLTLLVVVLVVVQVTGGRA